MHLHKTVSSAADHNYLQFTNSSTGTAPLDGFTLGLAADGAAYINMRENADMHLSVNGSSRLILKNSGKVGVGTVGPTKKLHVV